MPFNPKAPKPKLDNPGRGRHSVVTREEIEASCEEQHAAGHYPVQDRSGLQCGRNWFNDHRNAWAENRGITLRRCKSRMKYDGPHDKKKAKEPTKPDKIAVDCLGIVVTVAGPSAELDSPAEYRTARPQAERPPAGSVAELIWLYDHSHWQRPAKGGAPRGFRFGRMGQSRVMKAENP